MKHQVPVQLHQARPASTIVWFDGSCPLCAREIRWVQRLAKPGTIAFVDLRDEGIICPIDRQAMLARFHVRSGDVMYDGAAAFAAMWRGVPALWWLGQLARVPGMLALLEAGYRLFLRHRPWLAQRLR